MIQVTSVENARFLAKEEKRTFVKRKLDINNDDFQRVLDEEIRKLKEKEKENGR